MRSTRVVVIGGGILGAAVAYELAARGERDVLVLEAEPALNLHSAAYYIPMYESLAYASLAKASLPFLKNPPEGFSDRPIFSQDGALIAAIEGHGDGVKAEMAQAQALGIDVKAAGAAEIRELVPVARTELIEAAAYYPEAGEILRTPMSAAPSAPARPSRSPTVSWTSSATEKKSSASSPVRARPRASAWSTRPARGPAKWRRAPRRRRSTSWCSGVTSCACRSPSHGRARTGRSSVVRRSRSTTSRAAACSRSVRWMP
jgi:choline dehydrogenase-like flavoprotein